jgi:hypothetical protein
VLTLPLESLTFGRVQTLSVRCATKNHLDTIEPKKTAPQVALRGEAASLRRRKEIQVKSQGMFR